MEHVKKPEINAELIIFDLDGTLIDSSEDIGWAANKTLESMGYREKDMKTVIEAIGWGVKPLLQKLMPEESPENIDSARLKFLELYGGHLVVKTRLYPGVIETVEYFKRLNKKMAIVTNKPFKLAEGILSVLKMDKYFSMLIGGDTFPNKKPHPEPVEKAVSELKAAPERSVIVGDSPVDCHAGKAAGVKTIGVTYGYRGKEDLREAGCDIIINRFDELKEILR